MRKDVRSAGGRLQHRIKRRKKLQIRDVESFRLFGGRHQVRMKPVFADAARFGVVCGKQPDGADTDFCGFLKGEFQPLGFLDESDRQCQSTTRFGRHLLPLQNVATDALGVRVGDFGEKTEPFAIERLQAVAKRHPHHPDGMMRLALIKRELSGAFGRCVNQEAVHQLPMR